MCVSLWALSERVVDFELVRDGLAVDVAVAVPDLEEGLPPFRLCVTMCVSFSTRHYGYVSRVRFGLWRAPTHSSTCPWLSFPLSIVPRPDTSLETTLKLQRES